MTSITVEPPAEPTDTDVHPADILMNLIVAILAPMFLSGSGGNLGFARMAALHTIQAYRARNQADLLSIAQIIASGLAALNLLSLSMADNLSLSMTLRLSANANALNRSGEHNRRALKQNRADTTAATPVETSNEYPDEAKVLARVAETRKMANQARRDLEVATPPGQQTPIAQTPTAQPPITKAAHTPAPAAQIAPTQIAPTQIARTQIAPTQIIPTLAAAPRPAARTPASTLTDQQRQTMWGAAMADIAAELAAELHNLPPADRRIASMRANVLSSTANTLISGDPISLVPFSINPRHPTQPG